MVYYLRPSQSVNRSHYSMHQKPRYSFSSMNMSPSYKMDTPELSQQKEGVDSRQNESDDSLQHLTAYLVIAILVSAVTAVVIKFAIKPDANCVSYLTKKDKDGNVSLDPLKVSGASLVTGIAVSGLTALAHKLSLL